MGQHADQRILPNRVHIKEKHAYPSVCIPEKQNKAILPKESQFYQMAVDFYESVYEKISCSRIFYVFLITPNSFKS